MLRPISGKRFQVSTPLAIAAAIALGVSSLAQSPQKSTEDLNTISQNTTRNGQAANTNANSGSRAVSKKHGLNISLLLFRRG